MFGSLDISTSGMVAQRARLDAISSNIANQDTLLDVNGNVNPYRRKSVVFAVGDPGALTVRDRSLGVHVADVTSAAALPQPKEYNEQSPYAYTSGPYKGYVAQTDVNPIEEQIDAMEASRAYEANVAAAEVSKAMQNQALRLIA